MPVSHEGLLPFATWQQAQAGAKAVYDHLLGTAGPDYKCTANAALTVVSFGLSLAPDARPPLQAVPGDCDEQLKTLLKTHFLDCESVDDPDCDEGKTEAAAIPWGMLLSLLVSLLDSFFNNREPAQTMGKGTVQRGNRRPIPIPKK